MKFSKKFIDGMTEILFGSFLLLVFFLTISIIHGSRYDLETYCCRHMAKDLECFFEHIGIDTYIVTGDLKKGDGRHTWVIIDLFGYGLHIDSTTLIPGYPLLNYEDYDYFENYGQLEAYKGLRKLTKYDDY